MIDAIKNITTWKQFWDQYNHYMSCKDYDSLIYLCRNIDYIRLNIHSTIKKEEENDQ